MNELVTRLGRLDASAVSDALDQLGLHGTAGELRALSSTKRICGRAITVQIGPADGQPSTRHLCTAAVDASGPGDVIVIANGGRTDVAAWGGILSLAASVRRIEGVIIDGACRDLDEIRALELAVYARGAVPTTARGRIVEKSWSQPVNIAGVAVSPGDLVIADASGVVFIPADRAAQVIEAAERIVEREQRMADAIRGGASVAEVMGKRYENMLLNGPDSR